MTVIIPAYNCNSTLGRTLRSLVDQTTKDFKVLIVDDCSTENLFEVIDQYKARLAITVVKTPYNQGCGGARQKGIETVGVSDDYIIFVDADDILLPNAIEILKAAAIDKPDIIVTPFLKKELTGNIGFYRFFTGGAGTFMTHGKAYNTQFLFNKNIYSPPELRYFFNDWFLNHLVLNSTQSINILTTPIALYIKTPNSATTKKGNREKYVDEMRNLAKKILSNELIKRKIHSESLYRLNERRINWAFRCIEPYYQQLIKELQNK